MSGPDWAVAAFTAQQLIASGWYAANGDWSTGLFWFGIVIANLMILLKSTGVV